MGWSWSEQEGFIDNVLSKNGTDLDNCIKEIYTRFNSSGKLSQGYSVGTKVIDDFYTDVNNKISALKGMTHCKTFYASRDNSIYSAPHRASVDPCKVHNITFYDVKYTPCYGHDSSDDGSDYGPNYSSCNSNNTTDCPGDQSDYGHCCSNI